MQQIYTGLDENFEWTTDGWYRWNPIAARKAARKGRDSAARQLRAEGRKVTTFSLPGQLMTRGGIGTDHPHIEVLVTAYGLNSEEK